MKWYEKDPARFVLEKMLLSQFHPDIKLVKEKGLLHIHKTVRGQNGLYKGKLTYPRNFPYQTIRPYVMSPKIRKSPHRFSSGMLCLHEPDDVGPQTTGKVFCDWFVQWIHSYERWLKTGKWK